MAYPFRRLDTDEIIELDFETMMEKDVAGFVKVKIGDELVECREIRNSGGKAYHPEREIGPPPKVVNALNLGFMETQLEEFEEDRKQHGFHGIEFERNPDDPRFFQVVACSRDEMNRYGAHFGYYDHASKNGSAAGITAKELEEAKARAVRMYGERKK